MNPIPFWIPTFFATLACTLPVLIFVAFLSFPGAEKSTKKQDLVRGLALFICMFCWLGVSGWAAHSGWLLDFSGRPPNLVRLLVLQLLLCLALSFSGWGRRLAWGTPVALQIGLQGFRFPLELVMHETAQLGLMPPQMSFSGYNFDILTGLSAIFLAIYVHRARVLPRRVILAWNSIGLSLLLVVMSVAILSAPTPLRMFHNEPANTWIAHLPYVWLPAIMVSTAFVGHLLIFRRLLHRSPKQIACNGGKPMSA